MLELTKNFADSIREKSSQGVYRVNVTLNSSVVPIDVYPTVFPPQSDFSVSSRSVFEQFGPLDGLEVADIGTGSGVEAIVAALKGAKHVDASDINPNAVDCAKHNVDLNDLQSVVDVFNSDLFNKFPKKKYDLIIANLPIVDFEVDQDYVNMALYDGGFTIHKRFFLGARDFLANDGVMTFPHANLKSAKTAEPDKDFDILEKIIDEYGYVVAGKAERADLDYKWINYQIKLKK